MNCFTLESIPKTFFLHFSPFLFIFNVIINHHIINNITQKLQMILMNRRQPTQIPAHLLQIQKILALRHLERTQQYPTRKIQPLSDTLCERIETLTVLLIGALQFGENPITIHVVELQDGGAKFM